MTVTRAQQPPSWLHILDSCLRDRRRFRRLIVLILILAAFTITLVAIAGWPLAGIGSIATCALARRRARQLRQHD
ncbi:hypothetical protein AB0K15_25790 [Amycolatopsis sp. NPDC049253]|uniref:hypothetical protein n=1 Tax=Amycolatopsis sp. NPDC049253 TaxID=3155274 RepID=UPI0034338C9A